jgi:hypothetical protein
MITVNAAKHRLRDVFLVVVLALSGVTVSAVAALLWVIFGGSIGLPTLGSVESISDVQFPAGGRLVEARYAHPCSPDVTAVVDLAKGGGAQFLSDPMFTHKSRRRGILESVTPEDLQINRSDWRIERIKQFIAGEGGDHRGESVVFAVIDLDSPQRDRVYFMWSHG